MKRKIAILTALALVCSVCFFGGCDNDKAGNPKWYGQVYYSVMNTAAQLVVKGDDSKKGENKFKALSAAAEKLVRDIESSLSVTVESSSVAEFNAASAGERVEIDETAYEVLSLAKSVHTVTEGYYNPAVYYNVVAFGFDGGKNFPKSAEDLPDDETIEKYTRLTSHFGDLLLEENNGKYYAFKPNVTEIIGGEPYAMKIDLGGIGKGYAVDKVNALIDEYGYKYGYFNFGSSSIAFKTYSEKEEYALHLLNARGKDNGSYISTPVGYACVSTSGDYENYFELDGVRYCHVFSPITGKPVRTGIMTATIIGGNAAESDALTTALMAMGKERAVAFINEHLGDRRVAMSVEEDGNYGIITNMPASRFTIDNAFFTLLNTLSDGKIVFGDSNVF